jgi:hypothetical protein
VASVTRVERDVDHPGRDRARVDRYLRQADQDGLEGEEDHLDVAGHARGLIKVKLVGKIPGTRKLGVTAKNALLPADPALRLRARLSVDGAAGRCGDPGSRRPPASRRPARARSAASDRPRGEPPLQGRTRSALVPYPA